MSKSFDDSEVIPLCKSCVYYTLYKNGSWKMCGHPKADRSPISGELSSHCFEARSSMSGFCGDKGLEHSYKREEIPQKSCNGCAWKKSNWLGKEYTKCTHHYVVASHFDPIKGDLPDCRDERERGTKCGPEGALYE